MRGGAIPPLAWGGLLLVLGTINWIWTGDAIQVGTFAFAILAVWTVGSLLILVGRGETIKRGAPPPASGVASIPSGSLGSVLVAISLAAIVFGLAFGRFLIYFGAGLMVASLGRVLLELRAERLSRNRAGADREP
jgi:hypothetical protein